MGLSCSWGNPVIGYGLSSAGGGAATIFSFVDDDDAEAFFATCWMDFRIHVILNSPQVVFPCDYQIACESMTSDVLVQREYDRKPMLRLVV